MSLCNDNMMNDDLKYRSLLNKNIYNSISVLILGNLKQIRVYMQTVNQVNWKIEIGDGKLVVMLLFYYNYTMFRHSYMYRVTGVLHQLHTLPRIVFQLACPRSQYPIRQLYSCTVRSSSVSRSSQRYPLVHCRATSLIIALLYGGIDDLIRELVAQQ